MSKFIKIFDLEKKTRTLATKAEQDKLEELQTYDSSLFIGQSHVGRDGSQSFLIFQPIYKTFKSPTGLTDTIVNNGNLRGC